MTPFELQNKNIANGLTAHRLTLRNTPLGPIIMPSHIFQEFEERMFRNFPIRKAKSFIFRADKAAFLRTLRWPYTINGPQEVESIHNFIYIKEKPMVVWYRLSLI